MSDWFVQRETYEREIEHPKTKEKAKIVLRPLNAGDRAELQEMKITEGEDGEGEGTIQLSRQQMHAVRLALVEWSLPSPISPETIAQLEPRVFDQIYKHVSFGNPTHDVEAEAVEEDAQVTPLRGELGRGDEREGAAAS